MENRGVLIGSIIFVFASFFLMIGALVYESYKAKQMRQLALSITTETKVVETPAAQDFSMYKTLVGDDGREMVQIVRSGRSSSPPRFVPRTKGPAGTVTSSSGRGSSVPEDSGGRVPESSPTC